MSDYKLLYKKQGKQKKKKMLILGSGYLSSHLAPFLQKKDVDVVVKERHEIDLSKKGAAERIVEVLEEENYDTVFYAAFDKKGVQEGWLRVNIITPLDLVDKIEECALKVHLIFPGSVAELAWIRNSLSLRPNMSTASPPKGARARSFYGSMKESLREMLEAKSKSFKHCRVSWLWISTVYGGKMKDSHFFSIVSNALRKGRQVNLRLASSKRNYLHYTTFCECVYSLMQQDEQSTFKKYSLCGKETPTTRDVVNMFVRAFKQARYEIKEKEVLIYDSWPICEYDVELKHEPSELFLGIVEKEPRLEEEVKRIVGSLICSIDKRVMDDVKANYPLKHNDLEQLLHKR